VELPGVRTLLLLLLLSLAAWAQPAWVIIHEGNGVTAHNIPQGLSDKLSALAAQKPPIRCVFLTHAGGWGVIYGRNGY
jgi:hypothetical protein